MREWITPPVGFVFRRWVPAIFLLAILLSSCATLFDPESSQEFNSDQIGTINSANSIGQSITSRNALINGITLWLSRSNPDNNNPPGRLIINVFNNLTAKSPVFTTSISTVSITQNTPTQISFTPTSLPIGDPFFIELSTSDDEIIVHGRLEDSYAAGQAYQNRQAFNADLAFRVTYFYGTKEFVQDIIRLTTQGEFIFLVLAVLLIPGYAMVRLFHLNKLYTASEQLAFSVGLSLSIVPIIYLYGTRLGITLTLKNIQFIGISFLVMIIMMWMIDRSYQHLVKFIKHPIQYFQKNINRNALAGFLRFSLLLGILLIGYIIRVVMIRDLATPAWVNSIHHGLITRLIMDNGTLPNTYYPYMDIESTLYHPGFHSTLAAFLKLSGMNISQGMLFFGQVLNAAASLSVYLLAVTFTRRHTAGLFAALIASAFTAMPAYYTSWGRYPQLAGLIILPIPIALMLTLNSRSDKKQNFFLLFCGAIAITGLFLVHYRVAAFLACLFTAWVITELTFRRSSFRRIIKTYAKHFFILGLFTIILASLWLIPAVRDTFLPRIIPAHSEASLNFFSDFSWHYLTPVFGKQVIVIAIIGAAWALLNKQKLASTIIGWVFLLFFLANFDALNLPGGSFINNSSVTIMLFMPLSVMAGHLIEQLISHWRYIFNDRGHYLVVLALLIPIAYMTMKGSQQLISILNPSTLLSRQSDLTAIQWIDQNIPDDKLILINPFSWGYGLFAGSDGGAWIPALAGNQTIPPPVLYGLGSDTQKTYINQACQEIIRLGTSPDKLWDYLMAMNIEYIYVGARGGFISPETLSSNPHFEPIYHQENTWLFYLLP